MPVRTNIVINQDLMAKAMKATGARTQRETVELGLETLVRLQRQADLRALRGKFEWTGDLEAMRTDR